MTDPRPKRQCTLKRPLSYDETSAKSKPRKTIKKQKIVHADVTTIPPPPMTANVVDIQKNVVEGPPLQLSTPLPPPPLLDSNFQPTLMSDNYFSISTIDDSIDDAWKVVSDMPCFDGSIAFSNVSKIQITDLEKVSPLQTPDGLEGTEPKKCNSEEGDPKSVDPILKGVPPPTRILPATINNNNTKLQPPSPLKNKSTSQNSAVDRPPKHVIPKGSDPKTTTYKSNSSKTIVRSTAPKKPSTISNIVNKNNNNANTREPRQVPNTKRAPSSSSSSSSSTMSAPNRYADETPSNFSTGPQLNRTHCSKNRSENLRLQYKDSTSKLWDHIFAQYPESVFDLTPEKRAAVIKTYVLFYIFSLKTHRLVKSPYPK